MITKNTVFILGAGASIPYGFPSGEALVNTICRELEQHSLKNGVVSYNTSFPRDVISASRSTPEQIKKFRDALYYSRRTSVDAFLEHQPEFLTIGKIAIARALIACERKESLFRNGFPDWYRYFFNRLNTTFNDFDKNKISILTFNYDRSLEHFLYTVLKNAYPKTYDEEVFKKTRNLKIIHLYGQLGKYFPWERQYRPYEDKISSNCAELIMAGNGIKIISDNVENDPEFKEAHQLINAAEYVCFLGFGYNPANLERLGLKHLDPVKRPSFLGSVFGLTFAEINYLKSQMRAKFAIELDLTDSSRDCLDFLRNSDQLTNIYS